MASATLPTYDYETEDAALKRKQAIADAMMMGGLKPLDLPQQPGVKVGWTQALAKLMEGYVGGKMQEKLKTDRSALTERYNADTKAGFEAFDRTGRGYDAPSMALQPNADGTPTITRVPGDPRKAIFDAMASNNPVLRQFAMAQLAEQSKGQLTPKELAAHATNESVLSNVNDPRAWKPKLDLGAAAPGEVQYDKQSGRMVNLAPPVTPPGGVAPGGGIGSGLSGNAGPGWDTVKIEGDLYMRTPTGLKKLDNAPKVNVSATMAGQKAGMEEYWKKAANHVDALGNVATQASNLKQSIAELKNLDSQGIFSNATSGPATLLTNLGQLAGVKVDTTKLGNTETYNAVTTDLWQGLVAKYGGNRGVTKEEAVEIKKMLPLAASSPQARQQLFTILDNVSNRQIQQYSNANKSFAKAVKMDDPTVFAQEIGDVYMAKPTEPNPQTPASPQNKVLKWGEL